jgi:hypothetical protein
MPRVTETGDKLRCCGDCSSCGIHRVRPLIGRFSAWEQIFSDGGVQREGKLIGGKCEQDDYQMQDSTTSVVCGCC